MAGPGRAGIRGRPGERAAKAGARFDGSAEGYFYFPRESTSMDPGEKGTPASS